MTLFISSFRLFIKACIYFGINTFAIYYVSAPVDLHAPNGSPATINAMRLKYRTYYVEYNVNDVCKFFCCASLKFLVHLLCSALFVFLTNWFCW
jgi:hypothetical protein